MSPLRNSLRKAKKESKSIKLYPPQLIIGETAGDGSLSKKN